MKNQVLQGLIETLYERSRKENSRLFRAIADELSRSTRARRDVHPAKLSKVTKADEWIIVPGKVLGSGALKHKLNVIALSYSKSALEKIEGKKLTIAEFASSSTKVKGLRIIG